MAGPPVEPNSPPPTAPDPKGRGAGLPSVVSSLEHGLEQMGPVRPARTLRRINQDKGFDCPSCAWPDPDPGSRHTAEFCESGVKAVDHVARRSNTPVAQSLVVSFERHRG